MRLDDFDYYLPPEAIAQEPPERGASRLLMLPPTGDPEDYQIRDLPRLLRPGDLLVVNETKVIPARLFGKTAAGAVVELLLAERVSDCCWYALGRPGRKLRTGTRLDFSSGLQAEIVEVRSRDGRRKVLFNQPVEPWLEQLGETPLPPYIRRKPTLADRSRYQTIFARSPGSVAAPTAGLHFDAALLEELAQAGIQLGKITLHIGPGTFKPVTTPLVHEHRMDFEEYEIPEDTSALLLETRSRGGRIVAVGTTVVRTLESVALAGSGRVQPGKGKTDLFIYPGFRFQVVDLLITNFHLPRSTLLLLVCAFAGRERILRCYEKALERGYRFLSYGDATLLYPELPR